MSQALNTAPFKRRGRVLVEADAVALYSRATVLDGFPGEYPPDDTGSSGLAVAKAAVERGFVSAYNHAFGLDHALAALVLSPVIVGTNWYESMFTPDASGFVRPSGAIAGGHEYALIGLDPVKSRVTAINSWGPGWGNQGRFFLSFADLGRLLDESGDVVVPVQ